MSATTACIRPAGRARDTMRICASADMTRPIRGSIGPIPAPTPMAACRTAGCWFMPTRPRVCPDEHSETPYMTRRAMDFITEAEADGRPWCLHLSYIKPHWPYIAPEPYASMYGAADVLPAVRSEQERQSAHPVFAAYMDMRYSRNMARDEARDKVIPTYMGLIKQIDDQMGVLMDFLGSARPARHHDDRVHLRSRRLSRRSLDGREGPVPRRIRQDPADRGRSVARRPMPRAARCAMRWSRRSIWRRLSSIISAATPPGHILEGRSLMPLLRGDAPADWRKVRILRIRLLPCRTCG